MGYVNNVKHQIKFYFLLYDIGATANYKFDRH